MTAVESLVLGTWRERAIQDKRRRGCYWYGPGLALKDRPQTLFIGIAE